MESLTPAVLEKVLRDRGVTERELMDELKIPYNQQSKCKACGNMDTQVTVCPTCGSSQPPTKNDRRYHLLARIRRDSIFQGDKQTYNTIRTTSNKIEHGSAAFSEIWAVEFEVYEKTARYVREAMFDLIDLDASSRSCPGPWCMRVAA